jgi:hypothetical protein
LAAAFLSCLSGLEGCLSLTFAQGLEQAFARQTPIGGLRARVLDRYRQVGGAMAQRDAGGNLVHVLPARTGSVAEVLLEVGLVQ